MNSIFSDINVCEASYYVRNRGPWVTLEYDFIEGFSFGQTTALGDGAGCNFQKPVVRDNFFAYFPEVTYHQPRQVHGTNLEFVRNLFSSCYPATDGLVSKLSRAALTVLTADCLPVFVIETPVAENSRFALIHAGWRGLEKNIVGKAIDKYFRGRNLQVVVGAHVQQDSYPVNDKIINRFSRLLNCSLEKMRKLGIVAGNNKLDLFRVLGVLLSEAPAEIGNIYRLKLDTAGNGRIPLISYRQDKTVQRMQHWIFKEG